MLASGSVELKASDVPQLDGRQSRNVWQVVIVNKHIVFIRACFVFHFLTALIKQNHVQCSVANTLQKYYLGKEKPNTIVCFHLRLQTKKVR